ncbi:hypothetical protein EVAR_32931_1 [Eumeta japonica]|uniref:Uncharacterized protein n=1 Tax=Eumeta variegata TaxID=151549 RepID=A0A4C1X4E4_EUMVA|nr:hypothetical protein EVAR_32931_1 [Eumeta japonica]
MTGVIHQSHRNSHSLDKVHQKKLLLHVCINGRVLYVVLYEHALTDTRMYAHLPELQTCPPEARTHVHARKHPRTHTQTSFGRYIK